MRQGMSASSCWCPHLLRLSEIGELAGCLISIECADDMMGLAGRQVTALDGYLHLALIALSLRERWNIASLHSACAVCLLRTFGRILRLESLEPLLVLGGLPELRALGGCILLGQRGESE